MQVEDKYDGPKLQDGKVTLQFMQVNKNILDPFPTSIITNNRIKVNFRFWGKEFFTCVLCTLIKTLIIYL